MSGASDAQLHLVALVDKDLPGEPDVLVAFHLGKEDGAHAIGREMEAVMRLQGRARCVHRTRVVTVGNFYRVNALLRKT